MRGKDKAGEGERKGEKEKRKGSKGEIRKEDLEKAGRGGKGK